VSDIPLTGEVTTAMVNLARELDDFRDAGGESTYTAGRIMQLVIAVIKAASQHDSLTTTKE
jgi:hypothetical protein